MSLPLLLEIGTEEIPDWMIPGALKHLYELFQRLGIAHQNPKLDATRPCRVPKGPIGKDRPDESQRN